MIPLPRSERDAAYLERFDARDVIAVITLGDSPRCRGSAGMDVLRSVRAGWLRPRGVPGPGAAVPALNWIGDERIAISGVPPAAAVAAWLPTA